MRERDSGPETFSDRGVKREVRPSQYRFRFRPATRRPERIQMREQERIVPDRGLRRQKREHTLELAVAVEPSCEKSDVLCSRVRKTSRRLFVDLVRLLGMNSQLKIECQQRVRCIRRGQAIQCLEGAFLFVRWQIREARDSFQGGSLHRPRFVGD